MNLNRPLALVLSPILLNCLIVTSVFSEPVANLYSVSGEVDGRINSNWVAVKSGQSFGDSDAVKTGERSSAGIKFIDGFLVRLKEKTSIEFSKGKNNQPINIDSGTGYFFSRKPERFPEIKTPQVSASVRGTEFVVEVTSEQTKISVLQGAVIAENKFGSVNLAPGELAITKNGSAPVKQILLNPLDAVQWALQYPAIFDARDFANFLTLASSQGLSNLENCNYKMLW